MDEKLIRRLLSVRLRQRLRDDPPLYRQWKSQRQTLSGKLQAGLAVGYLGLVMTGLAFIPFFRLQEIHPVNANLFASGVYALCTSIWMAARFQSLLLQSDTLLVMFTLPASDEEMTTRIWRKCRINFIVFWAFLCVPLLGVAWLENFPPWGWGVTLFGSLLLTVATMALALGFAGTFSQKSISRLSFLAFAVVVGAGALVATKADLLQGANDWLVLAMQLLPTAWIGMGLQQLVIQRDLSGIWWLGGVICLAATYPAAWRHVLRVSRFDIEPPRPEFIFDDDEVELAFSGNEGHRTIDLSIASGVDPQFDLIGTSPATSVSREQVRASLEAAAMRQTTTRFTDRLINRVLTPRQKRVWRFLEGDAKTAGISPMLMGVVAALVLVRVFPFPEWLVTTTGSIGFMMLLLLIIMFGTFRGISPLQIGGMKWAWQSLYPLSYGELWWTGFKIACIRLIPYLVLAFPILLLWMGMRTWYCFPSVALILLIGIGYMLTLQLTMTFRGRVNRVLAFPLLVLLIGTPLVAAAVMAVVVLVQANIEKPQLGWLVLLPILGISILHWLAAARWMQRGKLDQMFTAQT